MGEYTVNKTRPLSQLLEDVILPAYKEETSLWANAFYYSRAEIQEDANAKFLSCPLNSKDRLKITFNPEINMFHVRHQKKDAGKNWIDGSFEHVSPNDIRPYLNSRISLSFFENKERNGARAALAAVASAAAIGLLSYGKAKAAEAPQVPEQDQPVAMQQHLEL